MDKISKKDVITEDIKLRLQKLFLMYPEIEQNLNEYFHPTENYSKEASFETPKLADYMIKVLMQTSHKTSKEKEKLPSNFPHFEDILFIDDEKRTQLLLTPFKGEKEKDIDWLTVLISKHLLDRHPIPKNYFTNKSNGRRVWQVLNQLDYSIHQASVIAQRDFCLEGSGKTFG